MKSTQAYHWLDSQHGNLLDVKHLSLEEGISLRELWLLLQRQDLQNNLLIGYFRIQFQGDKQHWEFEPEQPVLMHVLQRMKLVLPLEQESPITTSVLRKFLMAAITVDYHSHPVIDVDDNEVELWFQHK